MGVASFGVASALREPLAPADGVASTADKSLRHCFQHSRISLFIQDSSKTQLRVEVELEDSSKTQPQVEVELEISSKTQPRVEVELKEIQN